MANQSSDFPGYPRVLTAIIYVMETTVYKCHGFLLFRAKGHHKSGLWKLNLNTESFLFNRGGY